MKKLDRFKKRDQVALMVEVDAGLLEAAKKVAKKLGIPTNKKMVEAALWLLLENSK